MAGTEWENPCVFGVGKCPARASAVPENDGRCVDLNGEWSFLWYRCVADMAANKTRANRFECATKMMVPGNWELQAGAASERFGFPLYTNIGTAGPLELTPPRVAYKDAAGMGVDYNPTGVYRRQVALPASFRGLDVYLTVGAATSALYVNVNGVDIGYSQDSKLPAEFDITRALAKDGGEDGECIVTITLTVISWCDGAFLEDQDMWWLAGITRDVFLTARPKLHISDHFVRCSLLPTPSGDLMEGHGGLDLDVSVRDSSSSDGATSFAVTVELRGRTGETLFSRDVRGSTSTVGTIRGSTVSLGVALPFPIEPWTAETPALYTLLLTLKQQCAAGGPSLAVAEVIATKVGFRNVCVRGGRLLVNGTPITVKGVNRHEHDARTGHVISEEGMRRDIQMMKSFNFNAVRCSHYPNDERFYSLCDELGLYVIDEANIESHGMGFEPSTTLAGRPDYEAAHLDRVMRMCERDKNHCSIIAWSLANEAGNGPAFHRAYAALKKRDPTRPVQYENARVEPIWSQDSVETIDCNTDIYVPMYPSPSKLEKYGEANELSQTALPLIMCEYSHAMGNSCGGFREYWDVINKYGVLQGGFIWDWVDQGIEAYVEGQGWSTLENHNSFAGCNAFSCQHVSLDESKQLCIAKNFGGFVVCDGVAYFRAQTGRDLRAAARRADDATLHIAPILVPVGNGKSPNSKSSSGHRPLFAYGGDFGPSGTPSDHNFCINGLVQPDRLPNPHLSEVKHIQRPIVVRLSEHGGDQDTTSKIVVQNRFDFTALELSGLIGELEITQDGFVESTQTLALKSCPPGSTVTLSLPGGVQALLPRPGSHEPVGDNSNPRVQAYALERILTVRFVRSDGHVAAWDQFPLATPLSRGPSKLTSLQTTPVVVRTPSDIIRVSSGRLCVEVSPSTGMLTSLQYDGKEHFSAPMRPNFWRPATDNDFGWSSPKLLEAWRKSCTNDGGSFRLMEAPKVATTHEHAEISVRAKLLPDPDDTELKIRYTITPSADVIISSSFCPGSCSTIAVGSTVTLRNALTGRHLDVQGEIVRARWNDPGEWQRLVLQEGVEGHRTVSLVAHTGCFLETSSAEGLVARTQRATEYGPRAASITQSFKLERHLDVSLATQTPLVHGDVVVLKSSDGASVVAAEGGDSARLQLMPSDAQSNGSTWILENAASSLAPPRIGFVMTLDNGSEELNRCGRIQWFGRGPHESYVDRKAGAEVKLWDGPVAEQTFRYVRPQENGNKSDTRWAAVGDMSMGEGVLVSMHNDGPDETSQCLNVSAHHFLLDDFDAPATRKTEQTFKHGGSLELQPRNELCTLCVDAVQQGVGGIDSWGARPLPQHIVHMEELTWTFRLRPFGVNDPSPSELARCQPVWTTARANNKNNT